MKPAAQLKPPSSTHGFMSVSLCRCCCFFKRKRKKNTPRHKWSSTTGSECPAPLIVISKINKVPFRTNRGRQARDLDWIAFWRDQFKMVLRCTRCFVFLMGVFCFFKLFLFFPPLRCLEMMLQASPNEKPCCWNFAADNLFLFFLSKALVIWISLALFWGKLFLCFSRGGDGCCCFFCFFLGILPTSTLFLPSSHLFRVPVTAVPPCVFVNLFGFFPDMGLNVNLNAGQAESVTAYPHVQAQRASVCHFPPPPPCTFCFFVLQRGPPRHWGPREQETRDTSCTVFSEENSAHAAWLKNSP